jgi:hypothetical protein
MMFRNERKHLWVVHSESPILRPSSRPHDRSGASSERRFGVVGSLSGDDPGADWG